MSHLTLTPPQQSLVADGVLAVLGCWPASEFMGRDLSAIHDRIAGLAWELRPECRLLGVDEAEVEKALADLCDQGKVEIRTVLDRDGNFLENAVRLVRE